MPIALAAISALLWGIGDYCGAQASRASTAMTATCVSYISCIPVGLTWVAIADIGPPQPQELAWGAAAGALSMVGVWLFYLAFAAGEIAIVAPMSAVMAALVPIIAGMVFQSMPTLGALVGVGFALVSIVLISWTTSPEGHRFTVQPKVLALALGAGAGFGAYFAIMPLAAVREASPWPLMGDYCAGAILSAVILLLSRRAQQRPQITATTLKWAIPGGLAAGSGTAFYLLAATYGALAIVGPVASLYPAATVTLALVRDRERIQFHQGIGFVCAGAALALVAGLG